MDVATGDVLLRRAVRRAFRPHRPYNDRIHRFARDMGRLHAYPELPLPPARVTFTEMLDACAPDLIGPGVDVVVAVLGHAGWDAEPDWPACRLSALLPGGPLAFAVSDRGPATAWTALSVAVSQAKRHGGGRTLVVLLDQSGAPSGAGIPTTVDRLVALDLDVLTHRTARADTPVGARLELEVVERCADGRADASTDHGTAPTTGPWWAALDRLVAGERRVQIDVAAPPHGGLERVVIRVGRTAVPVDG